MPLFKGYFLVLCWGFPLSRRLQLFTIDSSTIVSEELQGGGGLPKREEEGKKKGKKPSSSCLT